MTGAEISHLASFHELRTLRLGLAGRHHEGDAHQLEQGLALLHVLLPHLDAGLEKTRVKKKKTAQWVYFLCFLGFFSFFCFFLFFYIFAQKREFLGFFQFQEYF